MENCMELVISNYIGKKMKERKKRLYASDEYIQQDNGDLIYLEKRYNELEIPYVLKRVIDDYIACLESRDERYADLSYVAGMGDAILMLNNMGLLKSQEKLAMNAK